MAASAGDGGDLGFDPARLDAFLREAFPGFEGPAGIEHVAGGQSNPTFFLTGGPRRLVLRKQPPGALLPSAHAIDREYRVMKALRPTAVPVPEVLLTCEDRAVLGTPFYLMTRVEGEVFHDGALPAVPVERRRAMYISLATTLAALHNVRPDDVGLADFGKGGSYFARQITRWTRQWSLSQTREDGNIARLIAWLPAHIPLEEPIPAIAHGDYRMGNVIFHPGGTEVGAVLDWELSTLGHPLADLAHSCIAWHSDPSEYGGLLGLDLASLGIPSQSEYVAAYEAAARHGLRMTSFHMAFALFRFAVIFEGIAARAHAGNAADADAARTGQLSANFARRAVAALEA